MRVIAGSLKGRRLKAPTWEGLRPTSDKLRETLFNVIGPRVGGGRGLDGYAGTGAVGTEPRRGTCDVCRVRSPRADAHRGEPLGLRNRVRLYYGPLNGDAGLVDAPGGPGVCTVRPDSARPAVRPSGRRDAGWRGPIIRAARGGCCRHCGRG